jgi:hypothetical protein
MSELCEWLHGQLERLPLVSYPFEIQSLPRNGIYFFYERGERWGHGRNRSRIVRIGTSRQGNFRNRIGEHFLLDVSKMNFDKERPAPHERSIFRKNIGRALLNKNSDSYLHVWNMDFTTRQNRETRAHLRDIRKEKEIEEEVTRILRRNFSFRFIIVDEQAQRMGTRGLESSLIGTLAICRLCQPSKAWLGLHSPKREIRESGLWLVQHLRSDVIDRHEKRDILAAIAKGRKWLER